MQFLAPLLFLLPSLSHAVITTAKEAVAIAPALISAGSTLESLLDDYTSLQYTIAALKLRSFLPADLKPSITAASAAAAATAATSAEESDSDDSKADGSDSDDSDTEEISSSSILASSLKVVMKSVQSPEQEAQILAFNPATQSLPELVAQKESEAQAKLLATLPILRNIQQLLKLEPINEPLNMSRLTKICAKIDAMNEELEEIESQHERLDSKKKEKREKAAAKIADSQAKILKLSQKVVKFLI